MMKNIIITITHVENNNIWYVVSRQKMLFERIEFPIISFLLEILYRFSPKSYLRHFDNVLIKIYDIFIKLKYP